MKLLMRGIILCLSVLFTLLVILSPASAQDVPCPQIVSTALQQTSQDCDAIGRNQACYGNNLVQADSMSGVSGFQFSAPGDVANVADIQTMRLAPLDTADSTWGVALMRIQANLPDTLPGQNVTLLLFGDVQIQNVSQSFAPSNTQGLTPEAAATLKSTPETYAPMQAFFVKTGLTQPACAEAPADGILIQAPQGLSQKVTLRINDAEVQLGSTVYLEAHAGDEMEISTLEGEATITAFGQSQTATTGKKIGIPLDNDLHASGPPSEPEAADVGVLLNLPVQNLPESIFAATPATAIGTSGTWTVTWGTSTGTCGFALSAPPSTVTLSVSSDGTTVTLHEGQTRTIVLTNDPAGTYNSGETSDGKMTFQFTSSDHAEGQLELPPAGCTIVYPLTLDRTGD